MKDRLRAFFASLIIIAYATASVSAADGSILGSEQLYGGRVKIADGTYYNKNIFYSDQSGVGRQTEYFFEYSPSENVSPVIVNGSSVYGRQDIMQAFDYAASYDLNPIAGINADFYSLKTGVPLSNCVSDGRIITKDNQPQDSVGFLHDGTAFVGFLGLYMTLHADEKTTVIENVNKYRQPYSVYLFTDDFATETYDSAPGLVVVLSDVSGEITVSGEVTATVESVDYYEGSTAIPHGKIVISVNDNLKEQESYKLLESLTPGQQVTVKTSFEGDSRFGEAVSIMGGSQGRLIENGVVNDKLEAGASPRSAVGVKADGSTVFYTIDGRQSGHSYGLQLKTLAKRLLELGCVDAINLDGGGSTTCAVALPGYSGFNVVNSPSDGSPRKNANYFFLVNNNEPTGKTERIFLYPLDLKVLSGAEYTMDVTAADKNFYKTAIDGADVTYNVDLGEVTGDKIIKFIGNGKAKVTASYDGLVDIKTYEVYETPTEIAVSSKADLTVDAGGTLQLNAEAYYKNSKLVSQNDCYTWSLGDERLGSIDKNGVFTAGSIKGLSGKVYISAGDCVGEAEITLNGSKASPENYHEISQPVIDGEKIKMSIANGMGLKLDSKDITFKLDGTSAPFEFTDGVLSCTADSGTHRLTVSVKNEFGNVTTEFFEINGTVTEQNVFADTEENWARDIISYMHSHGVINGYTETDGTQVFRPQDGMTRAQFAVMIANYLKADLDKYDDVTLPYDDIEALPTWADRQIKAVYGLDIIKGRADDDRMYFDPDALLTRAEAATVLSRILPYEAKKAKTEFTDSDDIPTWAADGIARLASFGAINGYNDGTVCPDKTITRAETAKILYSVF